MHKHSMTYRCSPMNATMFAIAIVLCVCSVGIHTASAQSLWKTKTPRDTTYVYAHDSTQTPAWVRTKDYSDDCISTKFYFSGTFGVFPWQDSTGFDARYMFSDPSWPAQYPLSNPPHWGGTGYQVYLEVSNNGLFSDADSVRGLGAYQPNHEYSAIYPGAGDYFYFRIYNQLNTYPNGYAYKLGTGKITIVSERYTAGISVQLNGINFPQTNVGLSSDTVDSVASYGIDPLEVDSVWIDGPEASNFRVNSQRGSRFTLDSVSANQFKVFYTPSAPQITSTATLHIHSPNADCSDTLTSIALSGYSAAPNGTIGPGTLDFGTQRAGSFSSADAIASNTGNAPYFIDSVTIFPSPGTPAGIFKTSLVTPDLIQGPGQGQIPFNFVPTSEQAYQATAYIWDSEGKLTKILLVGNGAMPHVVASQSTLNFDTVFTGNTVTLNDTITNTGNWTARIIEATLGCTNPGWFTFSPPDNSFYLDAGQSRVYTVTFQPATTTNISLNSCLQFTLDDGSQPAVIQLAGYEKQRAIKYDTNVVNFGRVKVGDSRTQNVPVQNQSSYPISFAYNFDTGFPNAPPLVFQVTPPSLDVFPVNTSGRPNDTLPLLFQPVTHGTAFTEMHILGTNGQVDSILLIGFGAVAQPVFSPDTINFGTCLDTTQNYFQVIVRDTGDYPLDICGLSIQGPDSNEFSLVRDTFLPYVVPDSNLGSVNFGFNFTTNAHTGGEHRATLIIHYCDGSIDSLPMEATEATASIEFMNPTPINFGKVRLGNRRDTAIGFVNPEDINFPIDTIRTTLNPPFSSTLNSYSVPPGYSYKDSLVFAPTIRKTYNGWLYAGGGEMVDDSIQITGIGAQSVPVLSTHAVDFPTQPLLTTSNPITFTLRDTGDWQLAAQIEKINDPNSEFTVTLQSGKTVDNVAEDSIAIGNSSTYSVTFTPRVPKLPDHQSELVFNYDDGTTDTVTLMGKDSYGFLTFDSDTIHFGLVRVGTVPALTASLGLLNTSGVTLTATNVATTDIIGPINSFAVTPNASIAVNSGDSTTLQVTFTPQAIGPAQSAIVGVGAPFNTSLRDTVIVEGIGAAPIPRLSVDTLFFDTVAWGRSITRSFTLADSGNWPLIVHCGQVTGLPAPNNALDFTPAIPLDTTIEDSTMTTYSVTFLASSPLQAAPRVGYLTWTKDDGSQFQLVLIANDVPPLHVQIGFPHPYWGRPGDKIAAELDLQSAIPDTMGINHIEGTITYDPTIVTVPPGGGPTAGNIVAGWHTVITAPLGSNGGIFNYDISSDTGILTQPGTLLNLMFQLQPNLPEGASSPLLGFDTIPNNPEVIASNAATTIFLDSICGTIHLLTGGLPIASFIEQNIPNPFGAGAWSTTVPFNVADDNTIVTIRLLDPTGREVLRPVDHIAFAQGRYQITIDGSSLHTGIYFYEFQTNGNPPQMLKMSVE